MTMVMPTGVASAMLPAAPARELTDEEVFGGGASPPPLHVRIAPNDHRKPKEMTDEEVFGAAPVSGADDGRSTYNNVGRGAGSRIVDILSGIATTAGAYIDPLADRLERNFPLGTVDIGADGAVSHRATTPAELASPNIVGEQVQGPQAAANKALDYQPRNTWQSVKDADGTLDTIEKAFGFGAEQMAVSLPDMAAVMTNLPAYVVGRTGEIGSERAKNDGRDVATAGDVTKALPAAAASAALERFATGKLLKPGAATVPAAVVKGTGREGFTEGGQEGIEYLGETVGTKKPINLKEMGDRILAGAVGGATSGGPVSGVSSAWESYAARKGVTPDTALDASTGIDIPQMQADAAAGDADAQTLLEAFGVTASSPEAAAQMEGRIERRQAQDAEGRSDLTTDDIPRYRGAAPNVRADAEAVANGDIDPAAAAQPPIRPAAPDVISVDGQGVANTGDPSLQRGADLRGKFNAPVPTEAQPNRMTPDEITRAQAQMRGGNRNAAPAQDRMTAPEGRAPQTADDIAGQREAGQAFDLADRQRGRVADDVADTQTAGRPEGQDPQRVYLDDDFPVEIIKREFIPAPGGRTVEVATVRRYDPRTGQPEDGAVEYQVAMRELRQRNFNKDPRQSQDFVDRANSPAGDRQGLPEQTYRATEADPEVPGADGPTSDPGDRGPVTRASRPEQDDGPSPFADTSAAEAEFAAREEARKAYEEAFRDEGQRARESAEDQYRGAKFSTKPKGQDNSGSWIVDEYGFVRSEKDGPIKFADQKQAAKWILSQGQKKSKTGQFFEMENHPSGSGFTVREKGRNTGPESDPPPSGTDTPPKGENATSGALLGLPGPKPAADQEPQARKPVDPEPEPETESKPDQEKAYRPVPKEPTRLAQWVRSKGGLKDPGGDVKAMIDKGQGRPGIINNRDGMSIDDLAEMASSENVQYFKVGERPTVADFLAALESDMQGDRKYSALDVDAVRERDAVLAENREIDRIAQDYGLDTEKMTRGEFADIMAERMSLEEAVLEADSIAESRDNAMQDAMQKHRRYVEEKGDAWIPENIYDPGVVRTLADMEAESGQDGFDGRDNVGAKRAEGREPAARNSAGVSEGDRTRGSGNADAGSRGEDQGKVKTKADYDAQVDADKEALRQKQSKLRKSGQERVEGEADGLFGTDRLQGKFYSNPVADPEVWRALGDIVGKISGYPAKKRAEWADQWQTTVANLSGKSAGPSHPFSAMGDIARTLVYSNDGYLRALAHHAKSPTIEKIADMFFARSGVDAGVQRTFGEAVTQHTQRRFNQIEKILGGFGKDQSALKQIVKQVQAPGLINKGTKIGDAAQAVRDLLKEELAYVREAGVDIGEVRKGYFPRETDKIEVLKNPAGFKAAAVKVYRSMGVDAKEARALAEAWYENIALGDIGVRLGGSDFITISGAMPSPKNTKARTLPKNTDQIMADYLIQNPADVLSSYVMRMSKRAEWARRMGDDMSKWQEMKQAMIDEGAETAIADVVKHLQSATGTMPTNMGRNKTFVASWFQVWNTVGLLPKATISSLSEVIVPAIRTGNALNSLRSVHTTVRALLKTSDTDALRELAEDLGIIGQVGHDMLMAQRFGGATDTKGSQFVTNQFFLRTGLHQYTEATRIASVGLGRMFIRRIALDVANGGSRSESSKRFLRELGVPKGQEAAFAKWLKSTDDGKPSVASLDFDYSGKGPNADHIQTYRTAMSRFADQSIMMSKAVERPYYANHPIGRLVYNLQSFLYSFQKNVINRAGNLAKQAVTEKGLTAADRMTMLAPAAMMPILLVVAGAVSEAREELLGDPTRERETADKMFLALSRSGLTGVADVYANMITGVKYERDIATTAVGPALGRLFDGGQTFIELFSSNNSASTNMAERKFVKAIWDLTIEPAGNAAMSILPGPAANALGIQVLSSGQAREAFVSAVVGKKKKDGEW